MAYWVIGCVIWETNSQWMMLLNNIITFSNILTAFNWYSPFSYYFKLDEFNKIVSVIDKRQLAINLQVQLSGNLLVISNFMFC